MKSNIYINAIKQISAQKPMSEDWFFNPIFYKEKFVKSIDEDYKQFFSQNETRRLGLILKRALITAIEATKSSNLSLPDAVITGTGLGCIENTYLFLDKLIRFGEQFLNPTQFMNSTHNTISSVIAIYMGCKGYNSTYTQKGVSFDSALLDAFMQLQNSQTSELENILVCGNDEMTPIYFNFLQKAGYLGQKNQTFASEISISMLLTTKKTTTTICNVEMIELLYGNVSEIENAISKYDIDAIMTGINGLESHDKVYFDFCNRYFPKTPILQYKNIFGESYSSSAMAVYATAECLKQKRIPKYMYFRNQCDLHPKTILCYNHSEGKHHSFIVLSNR